MIQDSHTRWIASMKTIPCNYDYLTAFDAILPRFRFDFFLHDVFIYCLFERSAKLPMNRGHDGLILNAARQFVELVKPIALDFYALRGRTLNWSERDYATLPADVVEQMVRSSSFQLRLKAHLKSKRSELYVSREGLVKSNRTPNEWQANARCGRIYTHVMDESNEVTVEEAIETFVRTLDYIEHVKHLPAYLDLYNIKRDLTSYLRVGRSVFEQWR